MSLLLGKKEGGRKLRLIHSPWYSAGKMFKLPSCSSTIKILLKIRTFEIFFSPPRSVFSASPHEISRADMGADGP